MQTERYRVPDTNRKTLVWVIIMQRNRFFIPSFIYEAIPFLYMITGILIFMETGIVPPRLIGGLLIFAGILITWMRIDYRFLSTKEQT